MQIEIQVYPIIHLPHCLRLQNAQVTEYGKIRYGIDGYGLADKNMVKVMSDESNASNGEFLNVWKICPFYAVWQTNNFGPRILKRVMLSNLMMNIYHDVYV